MSLITKLLRIYTLTVLFILSGAVVANAFEKPVINKKLVLEVSKKKVWSALTKAKELDKWWGKGVKLQPSIGGEFYEPWGDGQLATGKVLKLKPLKFIEFTWREKYWNKSEITKCRFIVKEKSGKTVLYVKHSGWEIFKDEESRTKLIKGFHKGWDVLLPKLKKYIEENQAAQS